MANTRKFLKARFEYSSKDLAQVLDRLEDQDLSWSPQTGMPTIAELLLEIANKEKETRVWLQTGIWPDDAPDSFDIATATVESVQATLVSLRAETYAYIDSLTDKELEQPVPNPNQWGEALRVEDCPLSEVIRGIAAHEFYHTGQLITYLWLRGDNPNDW